MLYDSRSLCMENVGEQRERERERERERLVSKGTGQGGEWSKREIIFRNGGLLTSSQCGTLD